MMGLIEDALRETFTEQVRTTPVVDDAAGRAIDAAGRVHRRRTVVSALAVAIGVAFATGAVSLIGGPPDHGVGGPATTRTSAPQRPVDVRTGTVIVTRDGRQISLERLASPVVEALRVTDGWLLTTTATTPPHRSLYHLREDSALTWLAGGERIIVSPDGRRVAWNADGAVSVAERFGRQLTVSHRTTGTGTLGPVAFAGGGVVLTRDGSPAEYRVWFPTEGQYVPGARTTARVAAATADGTQMFALVGALYPCVAVLDPDRLATVRRACDLFVKLDYALVPSPDGRWLLVRGPSRVDLYDLDGMWRVQAPVASWTVVARHVAWVDGTSFVLNGHGELLRGHVNEPGRLDELAVDADEDVVPIPAARP
jgi:hypothetical protein